MFMRQNYKIYASQITEKVGELISGIEKSNPGETNV